MFLTNSSLKFNKKKEKSTQEKLCFYQKFVDQGNITGKGTKENHVSITWGKKNYFIAKRQC